MGLEINLKQLKAFVWVADLGSFRRAAGRLNTTQPNISARISKLEAMLGVSLMERDAGSVRLTAKGQEFLTHARRVLGAMDDLAEATLRPELLDETLRLGVTEMIVHTWLREFLRVLKERYPKVSVELTVDLSINLERDLFARTIDLALQNGPFAQTTTGQVDLGTYPLVWVAAKSLNPDGHSLQVSDLAHYPVLTHARDTRLFQDVAAHFAAHRDLPVRLVPSSNLAACLQMSVDGMGIAALPAAMVAKEIAAGDLVLLEHHWHPGSLRFYARYDRDRTPQLVAKAAEIAAEVAARFTAEFSLSEAGG